MPYNLLIINGPNLGRLGERQPEIYGHSGLDELPGLLMEFLGGDFNRVEFSYYQSNHEGELIDRLEEAHDAGVHGVIINAGAFTHTSLALADCLAWIGIPYVEVHLSNVFARKEEVRHKSLIAAHALGVIGGFGLDSYGLAAKALLSRLERAGDPAGGATGGSTAAGAGNRAAGGRGSAGGAGRTAGARGAAGASCPHVGSGPEGAYRTAGAAVSAALAGRTPDSSRRSGSGAMGQAGLSRPTGAPLPDSPALDAVSARPELLTRSSRVARAMLAGGGQRPMTVAEFSELMADVSDEELLQLSPADAALADMALADAEFAAAGPVRPAARPENVSPAGQTASASRPAWAGGLPGAAAPVPAEPGSAAVGASRLSPAEAAGLSPAELAVLSLPELDRPVQLEQLLRLRQARSEALDELERDEPLLPGSGGGQGGRRR